MNESGASNETLRHFTAFVDGVMPQLEPYESVLYLHLLRRALAEGNPVAIGQRTAGSFIGISPQTKGAISMKQVRVIRDRLRDRGLLTLGQITRSGTLCHVTLPEDWPEYPATAEVGEVSVDWFRSASHRRELFERDGWRSTGSASAAASRGERRSS